MVEIPFIVHTIEPGVASSRRFAAASVLAAAIAAGLLLTALAVDDFRALLTAIGN